MCGCDFIAPVKPANLLPRLQAADEPLRKGSATALADSPGKSGGRQEFSLPGKTEQRAAACCVFNL